MAIAEFGHDEIPRTRLKVIGRTTAASGGVLFLLGVVLHPARDGAGIRSAGDVYGLTHDVQALGLLLLAVSLASGYAVNFQRLGRKAIPTVLTAMIGHLLWFALIVIDGSRNPVVAHYAPDVVHTPADLNAGVAAVVLPALLLFPLGYALLGRLLMRQGAKWPGLLIGTGAVVYTAGGLTIFAAGPHSPIVQIIEVAGAVPYTLGFVMISLRRASIAA
ncbi:hypothetical protein ACFOWE_24400 [Planomonospora corallina]|uniref:DUF4386 family protein n=1 Tax=Planomonospora corallina TaxID=1806052 RepID=A0ABV8IB49_9ACTN